MNELLEAAKEVLEDFDLYGQPISLKLLGKLRRAIEAAQQSVQRTCANCGASNWVTAGFPVSREYCKKCGASR